MIFRTFLFKQGIKWNTPERVGHVYRSARDQKVRRTLRGIFDCEGRESTCCSVRNATGGEFSTCALMLVPACLDIHEQNSSPKLWSGAWRSATHPSRAIPPSRLRASWSVPRPRAWQTPVYLWRLVVACIKMGAYNSDFADGRSLVRRGHDSDANYRYGAGLNSRIQFGHVCRRRNNMWRGLCHSQGNGIQTRGNGWNGMNGNGARGHGGGERYVFKVADHTFKTT